MRPNGATRTRLEHGSCMPTVQLAAAQPSLLGALHALASRPAAAATLLLVLIVGLAARLHVDLVGVEGLDRVDVCHCVGLDRLVVRLPLRHVQRRRQQLADGLLVLGSERVRELDREDEEEVAVHERVLVGRHALVLHRLHHPEGLLGLRIRQDVHRGALPRLLRGQRLLPAALLEVRAAAVYHEAADIDALPLELRLARLLQGVDVGRVRLGHVVDAGAVAVLHGLPLCLRLLLGEGIEALRHRLDNLARGRLDQQLSAIQVRELDIEAAEGIH
mmetsp:Transcript_52935/g.136738  ORF Transcript_52935/g.136738 Transcript_52935/m.136738 type:complete len:275 (-) Transcript_52935:928-1752(-)